MLRRRLQHVPQRGDEGVDAAAQVLQVDEQDVEGLHRCVGGFAHFAVEAEHRYAQDRVVEVRALDHVVLLVAAQPVLRAEGGGQLHVAERGQRVQRVGQVCRHRGGMGQQGYAAAGERLAQFRLGEEPIDSELHGS